MKRTILILTALFLAANSIQACELCEKQLNDFNKNKIKYAPRAVQKEIKQTIQENNSEISRIKGDASLSSNEKKEAIKNCKDVIKTHEEILLRTRFYDAGVAKPAAAARIDTQSQNSAYGIEIVGN